MFIKKWQLIYLSIGMMNWGGGNSAIKVGTGSGICQEKLPAGPGILPIFSDARDLPGGCSRLELTRT